MLVRVFSREQNFLAISTPPAPVMFLSVEPPMANPATRCRNSRSKSGKAYYSRLGERFVIAPEPRFYCSVAPNGTVTSGAKRTIAAQRALQVGINGVPFVRGADTFPTPTCNRTDHGVRGRSPVCHSRPSKRSEGKETQVPEPL